MGLLKWEIELWKNTRRNKGTTLQRRLITFFAMVVVCLLLSFTLLLIVFGITGSGRQAIEGYLEGELLHVLTAVEADMGNLSVVGIQLAERLVEEGDRISEELDMPLSMLLSEQNERLLSAQMRQLLSVAEQNACGGVFLVLDAPNGAGRLPGIFIKKTQPVSTASLTAKTYCLRGNADIARNHGVELLAQWQMDYDSGELPFWETVLQGARQYPDLPLSRLYYWSGRIRLNGNSETGILLCIPLRAEDGSVYGVCGVEISDRMFKQLYSPGESAYQNVFAIAAPLDGAFLRAESGLIAGNNYLTGSQMTEPFEAEGQEGAFAFYAGERDTYGGITKALKLYPTDSPYEGESWAMAILMPEALLTDAIRGSSATLFLIVAALLVVSLVSCIFISRRYLRPIHQGLSSIRERAYERSAADFGVVEIDALFTELAEEMRAHQKQLQKLQTERQDAQAQAEKAKTRVERLSGKKKQEIAPEAFAAFVANLKKLTVTEQRIFEFYLAGKTPKEIMNLTNIKENTLKYHNRNIYGKLGVASRKQLLEFATLMEQQEEGDGTV